MGIPTKYVPGSGLIILSSSLGILLVATLVVILSSVSPSHAMDVNAEVVPDSWENMGLYGGYVLDAVIDPATGWVYLVTDTKFGIYRSKNNGDLWEPLTNTVSGVEGSISVGSDGALYAALENGLNRSVDNGETWTVISEGTQHYSTRTAFSVDSLDPDHIVVGTDGSWAEAGSVYVTQDGGQNWFTATIDLPTQTGVFGIAIDPGDTNRVYAVSGPLGILGIPTNIYLSEDGGLQFQKVFTATIGEKLEDVAVNQTGTAFATGYQGVYRSFNGEDWESVKAYGGGFIAFAPNDPSKIYIDGAMSTNGGDSWEDGWKFGGFLAISPNNPDLMFSDSKIGIKRSLDGGLTWAEANYGFTGVFITSLAIDPTDNQIIYITSQTGFGLSYDGGRTWKYPLDDLDFTCWAVAVDPNQDGVVYVGNNGGGLYKSTDFGQTWISTTIHSVRPAPIWEIAIDPRENHKLYAAAADLSLDYLGGLYRSEDGGTTWVTTTLDGLPVNVVRAGANLTSTIVYAGVGDYWTQIITGGVYRSFDGLTWQPVGLQDLVVNALAVHPDDPNIVYAGVIPDQQNPEITPPLYRSDNGGVSWIPLYPCPEKCGGESLTFDPNPPHAVYFSYGNGLYKSTDSGVTWQPVEWDGSGGQIQAVFAPLDAPSPVEYLTTDVISSMVRLSWINPPTPDLAGVLIRTMTETFPTAHFQGTFLASQSAEPDNGGIFTHTNPISGTNYYYSVFAYDGNGRYSEPAWISTTVPINPANDVSSSRGEYLQSLLSPDQLSFIYAATSTGLYRVYETSHSLVYLPLAMKSK